MQIHRADDFSEGTALQEGTTVTFSLPVTSDRPEAPQDPPTIRSTPLTVLVIDDERDVRETLVEALKADDHLVFEAASGAEGLTMLENIDAIDVVFTDLGMPGVTGWEIARAIKRQRPTLPVVLMTGWHAGSEETHPERGTVDLILVKPWTSAALHQTLTTVSGRRPPAR